MSSRSEVVRLLGQGAPCRFAVVGRKTAEAVVGDAVFRDTGQRFTGMTYYGKIRKAGFRVFTRTGILVYRVTDIDGNMHREERSLAGTRILEEEQS